MAKGPVWGGGDGRVMHGFEPCLRLPPNGVHPGGAIEDGGRGKEHRKGQEHRAWKGGAVNHRPDLCTDGAFLQED